MRPSDPRLRLQLTPARLRLRGVVAAGLAASMAIILQAWCVTGLVLATLRNEDATSWTIGVIAAFTGRALAGLIGDILSAQSAALVGTGMRRRILQTLLGQGPNSSATPATGELGVLTTRGVSAVEPYLTRYLPAVVLAFALPPMTVVAIASQDTLSAVIVVVTLPLVPIFGALVGLNTRDRAREQWHLMKSLSGHFLDVMRGLPTLVVHRRAGAQIDAIGRITDEYRLATWRTLRLAFASSAVLELVATLSVALVAVTIGVRLASGDVDLQTALFVLLLAPEAYWPLRKVGAEFHAASEGVAAFETVDAVTSSATTGTPGSAPPIDADIELSAVSVLHPGRTVAAVAALDATVARRGVTVITGPSGCGKSTLLGVIAGLVSLTGGRVSAGGTSVEGSDWQQQIAWLPQRPVFLGASVAENMRLARPEATDDELWAALDRVGLIERVMSLPGHLAAPVGEDGMNMSAGERARLALSRVVLANRPWIMLDEPTAHLDADTEAFIADLLLDLGHTHGVVVASHSQAMADIASHHVRLAHPRPTGEPSGPVRARTTAASCVARPAEAAGLAHTTSSAGALPGLSSSVLLAAMASASGVALTATAGWLIVQASTHPPILTLLLAIVGVRTFGLARPVLRYVERLKSHDVALQSLARRRVAVYASLIPLTPGCLGRRRGDLLASLVDDVDSLVDRDLRVRLPLFCSVVVGVVASLAAALILPEAGAVVATMSLVAGCAAFFIARIGSKRAEAASVELRATLSEATVELIQAAQELIMWQAGNTATRSVVRVSDELGHAAVRASAWAAVARVGVLLTHALALVMMADIASAALAGGRVSGPFMALLVLLPLALADISMPLADAGALSARTSAALDRLNTLERSLPAVREDRDAPRHPSLAPEMETSRVTGGWGAADHSLQDLSLTLRPGDRLGIVGPSGSGKSTLAAMLLRFLDPHQGTVRLGGTDLRRLQSSQLRETVGLVDDDPHLFATTLVENVRLARPDASDAEVAAALGRAHLSDWLNDLPDGLDTWLGDGHASVSGGERARIAIARSLLANQSVLVLDEPVAHLDEATAGELAQELMTGPRCRTIVWITHSPIGLDLTDRTVRLSDPAHLATR